MTAGARPIRVWIVTETFYPVLGGGENHARILAGALTNIGLDVTILTRRVRSEWPARARVDGISVRRIRPSGRSTWLKYVSNLPLASLLWKERGAYDCVLVCGCRAFGPTAVTVSRCLRKPIVLRAEVAGELSGAFTRRRPGSTAFANNAVVRTLLDRRRRTMLRADRFVAVSEAVAAEYRTAGVPPARIHCIPNGIRLADFSPVDPGHKTSLRARLGLPADGLVVVYTGKLNRFKGLETLLAAWSSVRTETDAHLVLVGSGSNQSLSIEPELKVQAAALGADCRVHFAGRVERVSEWLQASDVFVFPSEAETFGISLVEAMATALPVVAADIPALRELVTHGRNGLLVPALDGGALAAALVRLLDSACERRALGRQAQADAARYDISEIGDRYATVLEEVVRGESWGGPDPADRCGRSSPG